MPSLRGKCNKRYISDKTHDSSDQGSMPGPYMNKIYLQSYFKEQRISWCFLRYIDQSIIVLF